MSITNSALCSGFAWLKFTAEVSKHQTIMSSTTPYLLAELLLAIAELLELPDREAIVKEIVKQADVVVVLQNIRQTPYQGVSDAS